MAIVDFEQDPEAPFGSGNFRDDMGRVMYVHDPDTASQFVRTMRGRKPDLRLARNDSGTAASQGIADVNAAVADFEGAMANPHPAKPPEPAPTPTPAPPAPGQPGAAATEGIAQTNAAVADIEKAVTAAPGSPAVAPAPAPGAPPVAPAGPPAPASAPGAPAVPGAAAAEPPPPGSPAALVQGLERVQASMSARLQPDAPPGVGGYSPEGLPLSAVESGQQVALKEGRDVGRVAEEIAERNRVGEAGDQTIRDAYAVKGRQAAEGFAAGRDAARGDYGRDVNTAFEKNAEARQAFEKVEGFKKALAENDKSVDPDSYVRNMSTGKKIGMIILAALNGGFGALIGQKNNGVVDALNNAIEQDIQRQRDEVASGRIRIQNDIDFFQKKGFSAQEAETLARDRLIKNLAAFKDYEAKRVAAGPQALAEANLLIQPRLEERTAENAMSLRSLENEVNRSLRAGQTYGMIPGTVITPQDSLATETLEDRRIQRENAAAVGEVVGHDVSIDEAKEIRNDAQDLGKRLATGASARSLLNQLRGELGLRKDPKTGKWTGDADPGSRPLGISATDRAKLIDSYYAQLKRADIMGMVREPSATLQNEFGKITERPFLDSQIRQQLDAYEAAVDLAEREARRGFSDEAIAYYDRKRTPVTKANAPPARGRAAPARSSAPAAARTPAAAPAAPAPAPAAPPAEPERKKAPGGLRFE